MKDNLIEKYLAPGENNWTDIADRVSSIMKNRADRSEAREDMLKKKYIPNSPTLCNANRAGRNQMACQVLHVENSVDGIMEAVKRAAIISKSGGGIGLEWSAVSPRGTPLKYTTGGEASGPVSFMRIFNTMAGVILEGGLRRAAMMSTLNVSHPDIAEFITCKTIDGGLSNFNISVTIDDDGPGSVDADTWSAICKNAYRNGEPGVVFLDHINANNPILATHGRMIAVNACAEQPLYDFGSCTLGHVVLNRVIDKPGDYNELRRVVRLGVRFLNRVIDVNHYPLHRFAQVARDIRNIGLGVMGWADLLKAQGIPFVSRDALVLADEIGGVIYKEADKESWAMGDGWKRYNSFLTTIALTGHTSRLAGVENSIYPDYKTGMNMLPDEHLDHVAAWQRHVDSAISYTISFPQDTPEGIVDTIYRGAYERGIKVMSVYRDNSRAGQPCSIKGDCT